jgi:uncharacterized protein
MEHTDEVSDSPAPVLPLELHFFEKGSEHYVFDVRNYAILKMGKKAADVLSRMPRQSVETIESDLSDRMSSAEVRHYYLRFLEMIRDGVFSLEPVARPSRPPFSHLVLMLAGGCNMGCKYCFEKDVPIYQKANLLTRERATEALEWFFRHQEGPRAHVQLYGGEALLNYDVLTFVVERLEAWANEKEVVLTKYLITNGTLLDPERIAWLKAHDVEVQVSVDGDATTHNRLRVFKSGKPTMGVIKPNIDELVQQGARFNLRAVLTRQNADPSAVLDGLRALGTDHVSFEVVSTDDRTSAFTDNDWDGFNQKYAQLVDEPFSEWSRLTHEMQEMIVRLCSHRRVFYGCGAGVSEVTVSPDGSIYECQRIYREPYSKLSAGKSPTELDSKLQTMVDDRPVCKDCWARYLCGGGCMQQAHVGHGKDEPLPQYCAMKRTLAEASIAKIVEIRAANATNVVPKGDGSDACIAAH